MSTNQDSGIKFPCTSCGLCCTMVGDILDNRDKVEDPLTKQLIDEFPYATHAGVCEKLVDNKCSVYEDRPTLCDITKVATLRGFDLPTYYRLNATLCNSWIQLNKLDKSFLINMEQFDDFN